MSIMCLFQTKLLFLDILLLHVNNISKGLFDNTSTFQQFLFSDHQGWSQSDNIHVGWFSQKTARFEEQANFPCSLIRLGFINHNSIEQTTTTNYDALALEIHLHIATVLFTCLQKRALDFAESISKDLTQSLSTCRQILFLDNFQSSN